MSHIQGPKPSSTPMSLTEEPPSMLLSHDAEPGVLAWSATIGLYNYNAGTHRSHSARSYDGIHRVSNRLKQVDLDEEEHLHLNGVRRVCCRRQEYYQVAIVP